MDRVRRYSSCWRPTLALEYCGYFLWRGLIDENVDSGAKVLDQIEHRLMFGMAPGGHSPLVI